MSPSSGLCPRCAHQDPARPEGEARDGLGQAVDVEQRPHRRPHDEDQRARGQRGAPRGFLEETAEIFRNLPRGQLVILPDTGHGTMTQRPGLANLAMREFLERPDAEKAPR